MVRRKSWREKVTGGRPHQVKQIHKDFAGLRAGQRALIPSAWIVEEAIREIPRGVDVDPKELRRSLAQRHGAEATCPVTFGIQLRVVAEAAHEGLEEGVAATDVAPVWRVLDAESTTVKKLTYDPEVLYRLRESEGLDRIRSA